MNKEKKQRLMDDPIVGPRADLVYDLLHTIPTENDLS